jgi:SAM-dependent methyltransferase
VIPEPTPEPFLRGCSGQLREFVAEAPLERTSILEFVARQARSLASEARVIDIGAGDAPYRELFAAQRYVTLDHAETDHSGKVDLLGSADSIPADAGSFDVVLCTQVLEHVPDPQRAMREFHRVLVPGGLLLATVPFVWEEHEAPHDYYRYTRWGIEHLLQQAGFGQAEVRPRTDSFTTLAQLARNVAWATGTAADGLDELRTEARAALDTISEALVTLAPLDVEMKLPLGYTVRALAQQL